MREGCPGLSNSPACIRNGPRNDRVPYGLPYPGPRTTRPGFAPVAFPSSTTGTPFTSTYRIPSDN